MPVSRTYRCLNCLDHAVTRAFDVSHVSLSCPACGEFERFVNSAVIEQFDAFEASPPSDLGWEELDRMEKFMVAERVARTDRTVDDFSVEAVSEDRD